ncbi:hypothetical protein R1sor_023048 [Riccia sorocarpa]|uniref:Uncharacterized protein n=1 Tax=Riccia sorocarpa TaxID=122646 RepID=A0ABD3GPL2_9MARC
MERFFEVKSARTINCLSKPILVNAFIDFSYVLSIYIQTDLETLRVIHYPKRNDTQKTDRMRYRIAAVYKAIHQGRRRDGEGGHPESASGEGWGWNGMRMMEGNKRSGASQKKPTPQCCGHDAAAGDNRAAEAGDRRQADGVGEDAAPDWG